MIYKILIIEDDQAIIRTIELALKLQWPEAKLIYSNMGKPGINLAKTQDLDGIILDLGLPDMSGLEVLRRIRQLSNIPIIVLTAHSEEEAVVKAFEEDATDYIAKPFRHQELIARLQSHIIRWKTNEIRTMISRKENSENN